MTWSYDIIPQLFDPLTNTVPAASINNECAPPQAICVISSKNPVVVDATLGLGGHTEALLQKFPHLTVIGIDRDLDAIAKATQRLAPYADRLKTAHSTFDRITDVVSSFGYSHIDGALFDLGVSSMQLDQAERGFSYSQDAPLDMRMDRTQSLTAGEIINTYEPGQLVRILRT
jgi:16S rRNA (cytosine1402-N4)-methyltransferase